MNRPVRPSDLFATADQRGIGAALRHLRAARQLLEPARALNARGTSDVRRRVTSAILILEGMAQQATQQQARDEEE
jgi:hypothetical protein